MGSDSHDNSRRAFCLKDALEIVGLPKVAKKAARTLSHGMMKRVALCQAFLGDAKVIFLDEPTDGVDPEGRRMMRELLVRMRQEGRTVFVNSHLLGELETVCDSVVILKDGAVVKQGKLEELTAGTTRFVVMTTEAIPEELAARFRSERLSVMGNRVEVPGADPAPVQPVLDALRGAGAIVSQVQQDRQSLEDLFLESMGRTAEKGREGAE